MNILYGYKLKLYIKENFNNMIFMMINNSRYF